MNCPRVPRDLSLGRTLVSYEQTVALKVEFRLIRSLWSSIPASNRVLAQCLVPSASAGPYVCGDINIQRSVSMVQC